MAGTKVAQAAKKTSRPFAPTPERMAEVLGVLKRAYPDAHCALNFSNPFELLVATILSAQCTDVRVNLVTPALFRAYPGPREMMAATQKQIEALVQSTGFFRNKAKSIREASRTIVEKHGGEVPRTLDELHALPGVGRKTANVVLGNAYGIPGLVVDTHVGRLCRRLGFTRETDAVKVEFAMMKLVPEKDWTLFSHWLIAHGRAVCAARSPKCSECPVAGLCPKRGV